MRKGRFFEPLSVGAALVVGALVAAVVYVFDPGPWVAGATAALLAALVGAAARRTRRSNDEGR